MESARCACVLIIFAVAIIGMSEGAQATEHMYLDYVICKFNPQLTSNSTCKLNFITRLKKSFTMKAFVTKEVRHVDIHTQLYYKFRNGYQLFLVNLKMNACDYLDGKAQSKVLDYIVPALRKYSDRNLTCPYSGWFHIKEMPINGELFDNMFLPVGNYLLNFTTFTKGEAYMWNLKFCFIIPEGKTIEDDRMGR